MECRKKEYNQGRKILNQSTNTSTSTSAMLMASTSPLKSNVVQESPYDIWYLDSGCSNHMTCNLKLFSSLDNSIQIDVTLGNNVQVTVLGKDTIDFLTKQGESNYMPDVYHVEGLKHNLLSIEQLIQKGYRVYMEDDHCVIKDKRPSDQLIAKVPMTSNHLFPLRIVPNIKGKTKTGAALKAESEETVEILTREKIAALICKLHFRQKFRMNPGYGISDLDI